MVEITNCWFVDHRALSYTHLLCLHCVGNCIAPYFGFYWCAIFVGVCLTLPWRYSRSFSEGTLLHLSRVILWTKPPSTVLLIVCNGQLTLWGLFLRAHYCLWVQRKCHIADHLQLWLWSTADILLSCDEPLRHWLHYKRGRWEQNWDAIFISPRGSAEHCKLPSMVQSRPTPGAEAFYEI